MQEAAKYAPWVLGGLGVSALENKLVGDELPEELKNINLGIGGVTGLLAANPASRFHALSSLPFKQLGLFGIAGMDKFRRAQQDLVDTNLATARINQATAATEQAAADDRRKAVTKFLLPALLGSGALAYYAYNQRKKSRPSRYKTVGQRGVTNRSKKVKLDIPASALPPEFFQSLVNADDRSGARLQLQEKTAAYQDESLGQALKDSWLGRLERKAERVPGNIWESGPGRAARTTGSILAELTGVPLVGRAVKDLSTGLGASAGGNEGVGSRYLLGGLGGAMLAIPAMRFGLMPAAAKLIGPSRLLRQIKPDTLGKALRSPITGKPTFAQSLLNTISGRGLSGAEKALLRNPATREKTFRQLYNNLGGGNRNLLDEMLRVRHAFKPRAFQPGAVPTTLMGEAGLAGRRLLHGGKELGRRGVAFGRRNPNLSLYAGGIPLSLMGTVRDEDKLRALPTSGIDYRSDRSPGQNLSSQLAGMLANVGSGGVPSVASQLR